MLRTNNCNQLTEKNVGEKVELCGWVHNRRDHGGIIFIDLRDHYGLTQIVFDPESSKKAHEAAEHVRSEWVLKVSGTVRKRGEGLANPKLNTGEIEVFITELDILNSAKTPPFEIDEHLPNVREDLRLEYRYLDLRRPKMQKNLKLRHQISKSIRDYFDNNEFLEIETPIMVKGTPEGSREYLVPSRLHRGEFYVLPQSPQQLKQLLVLGGVDKYFQIARCFRDEDLRGDRQPEFTQFEIEMAFAEQEDILNIIEGCFQEITKKCVPAKDFAKYLQDGKFQRLTWQEAMEKYGSDKPDIRFNLEFSNISDIAKNSGFGIFTNSTNLFALSVSKNLGTFSRKDIEELTKLAQTHGAGGLAWIRVGEDAGPVAKNSKQEFLDELFKRTGAKDGDIIFFGASDDFITAVEPLGAVRSAVGDKLELKKQGEFAYLWVTDFPMFEKKEDGSLGAAHHPFTRPNPKDVDKLKTDPTNVKSIAYDIVLNGVELGEGSIRIHDSKLQTEVFEALGMNPEEIQHKFGHLIK
ncbi:MAG: aspartate--tRNA ligase, partial [Candidatus Peregrinibacteria bacterium]|nr:aspartate--tRNA ligase [Candidatus Peregrinibacteria bacterium]